MAKPRSFLAFLLLVAGALRAGEEPKGPLPKAKAPAEEARWVQFPFYHPDTGELQWKVLAAKVATDPKNPRLLRGETVRIIVYRDGKPQTATGKTGVVDMDSRAANLVGDVVLEFGDEQGTRVETDDLAWDSQNGTATTKGPVKITRTDAAITGTGVRLWLSDVRGEDGKRGKTGLLVIEKRVRTELLPGLNANLLQGAKGGNGEPIVITCDNSLSMSHGALTAVFRDNVRAVQGKQSLACDLLNVGVEAAPGAQKGQAVLRSIEATGSVRLDDGRTLAVSDSAEWNRERGSMKLIGQPAEVRWDNGNRLLAGLVHRMGDGAEILCSSTAAYPRDVYLVAYTQAEASAGPEKADPSNLRVADIAEWPVFCSVLATQAIAKAPSPGRRVWALLPDGPRSAIQSAALGTYLGQERRTEITAALNSILRNPEFHREEDFRDVPLSDEVKALLKLDRKGMAEGQVRKLNRGLLDAAFRGLIGKPQAPKYPAPQKRGQ